MTLLFRRFTLSAAMALLALSTGATFAQGMPPSGVGVIVLQPETIPVISELPGRVSATQIAEVRPRVGGIIEKRLFEQGSLVKEGDVLFQLDKASYEIAAEAARANVARAEAVLLEAQQNAGRLAALNARNITSKSDFETATATRLQAEAGLAEARAQVRAAELNLSYADIKAPISGRIGRALITEGALVAAQGDVLTTIQQLDTVYVDMQQPVSELLRLRAALAKGELVMVEPDVARVVLHLDDGSQYQHPGRLLFAEAFVERSSGQVTLRAQFPNAEGVLLPGMYVRVMVEQATEANALAIPAQAVQRDASGAALVYVVTDKQAADLRPVTLGRSVGNRVIVLSGLAADDMVIVDGFQKIGPGAPVSPVCWFDPSQAQASAPEVCTKRLPPAAPAADPAKN